MRRRIGIRRRGATIVNEGEMQRVPGFNSLLGMSALGFAGFGLLLPTAPLWAAYGGAGSTGVGLVNAVLMAVTVLSQTGVHRALRRFGWRAVLVTGLICLGLPSLGFAASDALAWILVLSAVRGVGFGILTVCGASAVAELTDESVRGRAVGRYGLALSLPQLLLVPTSAWLADSVAPTVIFTAGAVPVLGIPLALALGARLDARTSEHASDEHAAHTGVRALATLLLPTFALLAVTVPGGALLSFTAQFAPDATATLFALFAFTGTGVLARWLIGHAADRYGPFRLQPVFLALGAVGLVATALAIRGDGNTTALVVGMALTGVCYGSVQNLTLVAAFTVTPGRHDLASTVWNMGFDIGTGIGSLLVGAIAGATSFTAGLLTTAVLVATASAITLAPALARRPVTEMAHP